MSDQVKKPERWFSHDMAQFISVYVRAVGGEVPATSTLAPKIGPLGLVSFSLLKTNLIEYKLDACPSVLFSVISGTRLKQKEKEESTLKQKNINDSLTLHKMSIRIRWKIQQKIDLQFSTFGVMITALFGHQYWSNWL